MNGNGQKLVDHFHSEYKPSSGPLSLSVQDQIFAIQATIFDSVHVRWDSADLFE